MRLNTDALIKLAESKNWSIPELAKRLGVNYSHLFRVLNKEKGAGVKLFTGVYNLCQEEGLDAKQYIFLSEPLSADNGKGIHKATGT